MNTVFVIGASGFVGRHVVRYLADNGLRVIATRRPGSTVSEPGVEWIPADLASSDVALWPRRYDAVVYLAQSSRWRDFPGGAEDVVRVNVDSVLRAADHARKAGATEFVNMSTGSVYAQTNSPAREEDPIPTETPRSFYVASKLAAELLLGPFSSEFSVTHLRLFMPYGPGENEKMLIPRLVRKIEIEETIDLHGPDGLKCNPVYVRDVAEAVHRCLGLKGTRTLNLAGPEILSLREVSEMIGSVLHKQPRFQVHPDTGPVIVGSTAKLGECLGWQPATPFRDGVRHWLANRA